MVNVFLFMRSSVQRPRFVPFHSSLLDGSNCVCSDEKSMFLQIIEVHQFLAGPRTETFEVQIGLMI